jgi:hypothetical protein
LRLIRDCRDGCYANAIYPIAQRGASHRLSIKA